MCTEGPRVAFLCIPFVPSVCEYVLPFLPVCRFFLLVVPFHFIFLQQRVQYETNTAIWVRIEFGVRPRSAESLPVVFLYFFSVFLQKKMCFVFCVFPGRASPPRCVLWAETDRCLCAMGKTLCFFRIFVFSREAFCHAWCWVARCGAVRVYNHKMSVGCFYLLLDLTF